MSTEYNYELSILLILKLIKYGIYRKVKEIFEEGGRCFLNRCVDITFSQTVIYT